MVVLTENNLNKRHREFNRKVTETVAKNVNFDNVKAEVSESDIGNLFKIDVASKYKNIEYILEVLKSGDSLCIARVLKCGWMFDSEYSHIINPQYINDNLFPHLSLKSKKKLLTAISVHVTDEQRALDFYNFCQSIKYCDIAYKFAVHLSHEAKIKIINENISWLNSTNRSYAKHFFGDSFHLAESYLRKTLECNRSAILHEMRYFYSIKEIGTKYLDLVEQYVDPTITDWRYHMKKFGLRMSKDIILKHKKRIYDRPLLYTKLLKESLLVKYSTVDDAKYYTTALLPENSQKFWEQDYYRQKRYLFDIIPKENKYGFIKKIFNEKYPEDPFELTFEFYNLKYYDLLIDLEQKEEWAMRHIESGKEILGPNKDFLWYRFVRFDKAFEAIKKYIRVNSNKDERAQIVNVLVESAKDNRELETLFKYYYERHINEEPRLKERFLDNVDRHHNILGFDHNCFSALDKIYYSVEVYNMSPTFWCNSDYKIIALVYRIINKIQMPEAIIKFMDDSIPLYTLTNNYCTKLEPEKSKLVFEYLMEFYLNKIKLLEEKTFDEAVIKDVIKYVTIVLDLMDRFEKTKEEIPEIVMKFVKLYWDEFKYCSFFRTTSPNPLTVNDLIRCLKRDTSEFVSKFPELKITLRQRLDFNFNEVLRKLQVYFSNDLAKEYFELYEEILDDPNIDVHTVNIVVFGLIYLADNKYLEDFMTRYAPKEPKIDHVNIDRKLLSIQSAICSYAGYARPPVSLDIMLKYVQGDYTQYCLPIFNMYLSNLRPTLCTDFIKSILDAPIYVQKHGLRMAFKSFPIHDLKSLISNMWERTRNVSLRFVIYKALHNKIIELNMEDGSSLFEILNRFTSTVYEEDDEQLFQLLTSDTLHSYLWNEHLKTVWTTIEKLPYTLKCIEYKKNAVKCLERNLSTIEPQSFIEKIVYDHVQFDFDHSQNEELYQMLIKGEVIECKWDLTAAYLTYPKYEEKDKQLKLATFITSKCIENWNKEVDDIREYRNIFIMFIDLLHTKRDRDVDSYKHVNMLYECILEKLMSLPIEDNYQLVWDLEMRIRVRNIIFDVKNKTGDPSDLMREAGVRLGQECVAMVSEYRNDGKFWILFVHDIRRAIESAANTITHFWKIDTNGVFVLICMELAELEGFEVFTLTSHILPVYYEGQFVTEYNNIISKWYDTTDPQIRCFVYQKFIKKNAYGCIFIRSKF